MVEDVSAVDGVSEGSAADGAADTGWGVVVAQWLDLVSFSASAGDPQNCPASLVQRLAARQQLALLLSGCDR